MKKTLNHSKESWLDEGKIFIHDGKLFQYKSAVVKVEGKPGHKTAIMTAKFVRNLSQVELDQPVTLLPNFGETIDCALTHPTKIVRPPGCLLSNFAEFIFSKQKLHAILLPVIVDMREEYFEALSQDRIWKAHWVRIRGTWSFFAAVGLDRAFAFVSFFVKAWKSVN
jgi:hypothetical protein